MSGCSRRPTPMPSPAATTLRRQRTPWLPIPLADHRRVGADRSLCSRRPGAVTAATGSVAASAPAAPRPPRRAGSRTTTTGVRVTPASTSESTVVIEGDIAPRRLRRPTDLLRLVAALVVAALLISTSYVASATTSGIDTDLSQATGRIPQLLLDVTSWVGALGAIALPIAVSISLLIRRRGRLLLEALAALVLAILIGALLTWLIKSYARHRCCRPSPGGRSSATPSR